MPSKVEMELIQATKFRMPKGGYPERQDYLAALAKATKGMTDADYDELTDPAAEWVKATIDSIRAGTEIEDFEDAVVEESEDTDETSADEDPDDGDDEAAGADDGDSTADDPEADAVAESDNEAEEAAQEARSAKPKQRSGNKGNAVATSKAKSGGKAAPSAPEAKAPSKKKKEVSRYDSVTGAKDRYGCIVGTKTADAVAMYEEGATSAQIGKKLGGRFYNILRALEEKGHQVERLPGGVFRLTHVEDIDPKKGKK